MRGFPVAGYIYILVYLVYHECIRERGALVESEAGPFNVFGFLFRLRWIPHTPRSIYLSINYCICICIHFFALIRDSPKVQTTWSRLPSATLREAKPRAGAEHSIGNGCERGAFVIWNFCYVLFLRVPVVDMAQGRPCYALSNQTERDTARRSRVSSSSLNHSSLKHSIMFTP